MRQFILLPCLMLLCPISLVAQEEVHFESQDGLKMTADFYGNADDKTRPLICLFHQAGWSRGEYREIAPKLVEMGFNCLAVDCRSGGKVNGVTNETAAESDKKGERVGYDFIKAYPDIVAALKYAKQRHAEGKLIAWGSSYSASLVLKASAENKGLVDGTLSFAPNANARWAKDWIIESAKSLHHPVFITSAKHEKGNWQAIIDALPERMGTSFVPETAGNHGSRALWKQFSDSQDYWTAVTAFLKENFLGG